MAEQLAKEEIVTMEELVVSHSYEIIALITVLEKKGILTRTEIIETLSILHGDGTWSQDS